MSTEAFIRAKVKCCACGKPLKASRNLNLVCLMKEAKWLHPCWGNYLLGVWGFAGAVLCDRCIQEDREPRYAVEWDLKRGTVKYHPVEDLADVPKEIFDLLDELEPGRHGIAY